MHELGELVLAARRAKELSRNQFLELCLQATDDDNVTLDWLVRIEQGTRASLSPWEIQVLQHGLAAIGATHCDRPITAHTLLVVLGYIAPRDDREPHGR